jgi:hypothetical protein
MVALFELSTTVGWAILMYKSAASKGIDLTPEPLSNSYIMFFFLIFIIVGSFFMINLFVGVVISTFNREKEKLGKNFMLTKGQKAWKEQKMMLIKAKPLIKTRYPENRCRQIFFKLAKNKHFDNIILAAIILNTIILAIKWYGQPQIIDDIATNINLVFAVIFTVEAAVKLIAFGSRYFKDSWNNFDLVIVIMTIVGLILGSVSDIKLGSQTTIVRSFRIGRVFKLFRRNKSLKIIFQTLVVTLPALANVGSLLLLFVYIYSILGVFMFSSIKLNGALHENVNF